MKKNITNNQLDEVNKAAKPQHDMVKLGKASDLTLGFIGDSIEWSMGVARPNYK